MDEKILFWIIGALFTIAWGFLFFMLKKHDEKIECNTSTIANVKADVITIESKIWDEDKIMLKLEKMIYNVMTKIKAEQLEEENKLLKQRLRVKSDE